MTKQRRTPETETNIPPRRWANKIVWAAALLAVPAFIVFGGTLCGQWARYMATSDMDAWAITDAQHWLDRAERYDPDNAATLLLRAKCYRYFGQWERRTEVLDKARRQGAEKTDLENEVTLGQIQLGDLAEGAESRLGELAQSGLSPHDIASAYIDGRIASQDMERAHALLQAWSADFPGEPHIHYMRGMLWSQGNEKARARDEFETTLAKQPRHELAQLALAKLYEEEQSYDEALRIYMKLASRDRENENLRVGLARVLRNQGRIEQARAILTPAMAQNPTPPAVAVEAGELELESGNYEQAEQWFRKLTTEELVNHTTLSSAAVTLALMGQTTPAEKAFQWIVTEVTAVTTMHDLQTRMQANPGDERVAGEFQELLRKLANTSANENPLELALATTDPTEAGLSEGMLLYNQHCSTCHGPEGGGDGRAARHLYPRPRNLRREKMRLVSTRVGIPTTSDIKTVIRKGVPGTAMAPLETLQDRELDQLAEVVHQIRSDGVREEYIAALLADEEAIDPEDVAEVVAIQTSPREIVTPPVIAAASEASIQLGEQLYATQTCDSCHGASGTGDENTPLFDDLGRPAFPRDLVHESFKGGNTAESIYMRIQLGMPGSPHPANVGLAEQQLIALVHYCQSLGQEPKTTLTNHQRAIRATSRPVLEVVKVEPRKGEL